MWLLAKDTGNGLGHPQGAVQPTAQTRKYNFCMCFFSALVALIQYRKKTWFSESRIEVACSRDWWSPSLGFWLNPVPRRRAASTKEEDEVYARG